MILISLALLLILLFAPMSRAESINTTPTNEFDIDKYMGKWHEIARFDNRFERNLTDVTAEYSIDDNDKITIINRGFNTEDKVWKEAHGRGKSTSKQGQLRVSFFLFFSSEYNVMELGNNYEWALVGTNSSKFLWILSRTPTLPSETLNHIISLAEQRGYDVEKLNIIQRNIYPKT